MSTGIDDHARSSALTMVYLIYALLRPEKF